MSGPSALSGLRSAVRKETVLLTLALVLTLGAGLTLRLYGLDWDRGYDYTPHPDERAILGKVGELSPPSLLQFFDADQSPWNPRWFPYGSFPLYLLKSVQIAYSAVTDGELGDLRYAGRLVSALADVGTLFLVYLLGSRMYGRREGLLASALLAMAVIHIQLSHFFAVDTILGLCTVAALYFMYRVVEEGRLRDSLVAGALIGLGVATKVSLAPIILAFVMAHLLFLFWPTGSRSPAGLGERRRIAFKGLAAGAAASLTVFLVVQPYALLDWARFLGDVSEQSEMVRRIRDYPYTRQYIDTTPYLYHARQLATWGLGWPLGVLAWVGLVYVSLRGMRLGAGLAYLGLGWGVPMAVLVYSPSFAAMAVASVIAFAALFATLPVRSPQSRSGVLLLAWVAPYFLLTGAFQVKFLRYLLPITPILVLMGSRMALALWDRFSPRGPAFRLGLASALLLLLGGTAFYALSYTAVYREPHTAVRMSRWINANAAPGSVILNEHWEEGLPGLGRYEVRTLPLYDDDTPAKLSTLAADLADADYILFFSNRLYGTITRLPERYPFTSAYYRLLFSGELGYELANVESAYPRLLGINIVDDTFGRPGLTRPDAVRALGPSGPTLNLGYADESFSVYDHPLGLLFRNVARYSAESIVKTIRAGVPDGGLLRGSGRDAPTGLMLSREDAVAQQQGGTWSDIIMESSWTNRFPVLAWLLLIELMALLVLPVALVLFRPLPDRGYLFSKALGLLAVALPVWLLASLHWLPFSRESIAVALLIVGVSSLVVLAGRWRGLMAFARERWRVLLIGEAVFLLAFFGFVALRMANPDLWHPYLGGEKPMDQAYLNAVLRSTYMPPYDPWYGGGYLNYYYMGQFMVATMIKATGIEPTVAFNLAVALFFALTVAGAYTIVYNLVEGTCRSMGRFPAGITGMKWSPVLAGLAGAAFVVVLGNLDGAAQLGHGVWRALFGNMPFGAFDFWRSSRMMPPGNEITEFPFFTFLFADLHAHLLALPYTLLALGLSLAVVLGGRRLAAGRTRASGQRRWGLDEMARLAALGVTVGALRTINTWDFPTYMIIAAAAVLMAAYLRNGGLSLLVLVESGIKSVVVLAVGFLAFLPFHLNYETFFTSLDATTNQTVLWQFLAINGLFVFIIGSFFVGQAGRWLLPWSRGLWNGLAVLSRVPSRDRDLAAAGNGHGPVGLIRTSLLALAVAASVLVAYVTVSARLGSTIPFLVLMVAVVAVVAARTLTAARGDAPYLDFVAVMVLVALALAIGLDVFRVEGDIDRMNSVFKFYMQIWVLLALASAYLLWRLLYTNWRPLRALGVGKRIWLGMLAALVLSASVYPVFGTQVRLRNRFDIRPRTLDGAAYMIGAVYHDEHGPIRLSSDYKGIRWLQKEVRGSPIILEGNTPLYRWGGRVSVYTGLPSVVGWQWHQEQQRWGYRDAVGKRVRDVERIYSTTDAALAMSLLRKYGVEYVYVGQLEELYYPSEGLRKFDEGLAGQLEAVYRNEGVTIYRVLDQG